MNKLFKDHEIQFLVWFSGVFLATIAFLAVFHLLPNEFEQDNGDLSFFEKTKLALLGVSGTEPSKPTVTNTTPVIKANTIIAEDPVRIVIPNAQVDINVRNPLTTDPDFLDTELSRGVVHYPGSGMPGVGNMFIFGHSTGFSVVQNPAYKAFNNIHTLQNEDLIMVYSTKHIYTYKVQSVKKVDKNDTWVQFDGSKNMLTLSTCDSFGTKSDRYVVQAEYVGLQDIKS